MQQRVEQQVEQDDQLAMQLQAEEQGRVDRLIQLGPAKRTTPYMEGKVAAAHQAFSLDVAELLSDDDDGQRSMLLACRVSKQVLNEVEADHE